MDIDLAAYITPDDAARDLRVSTETIRRWARDGDIRGIKIGGRWWIHRDVLRVTAPPKDSKKK